MQNVNRTFDPEPKKSIVAVRVRDINNVTDSARPSKPSNRSRHLNLDYQKPNRKQEDDCERLYDERNRGKNPVGHRVRGSRSGDLCTTQP